MSPTTMSTTSGAIGPEVRPRPQAVRLVQEAPKGYVVKTITVKVDAKKVATLKTEQPRKPLHLRKLPTGTFTITVTIKLTKGRGLTGGRRYTTCK
jgi:hypothetical protein